MNATAIISLFSSLLALVEGLVPTIQGLFAKGEVSIEQQQALKDRIDALRKKVSEPGPLVDDGM
jgi:hypothetical protein